MELSVVLLRAFYHGDCATVVGYGGDELKTHLKEATMSTLAKLTVLTTAALMSAPAVAEPAAAAGSSKTFGAATKVGGVTVWPVYGAADSDIEYISLAAAEAAGTVEVSEVKADKTAPVADDEAASAVRAPDARPRPEQVQQAANINLLNNVQQRQGYNVQRGGGARVDTVTIANLGDKPILVLAGTVIKGGKQDRQIGADLIVLAKSTVNVSAFCVEHGRWDGKREGKSTAGRFQAQAVLANKQVRDAANYDRDQSKVWANVKQFNVQSKSSAASDTLLATLDNPTLQAERRQLQVALERAFASGSPTGFAYAVDGKLAEVRTFANAATFAHFKETIVNTLAVEAQVGAASGQGARPVAVNVQGAFASLRARTGKVAPKVIADLPASATSHRVSDDAKQTTCRYKGRGNGGVQHTVTEAWSS